MKKDSSTMITFAVGDSHGCSKELERLLAKCEMSVEGGEEFRFVFLGDYIDRGPDSKGVVDIVRRTLKERPGSVALMGNHEDMLLNDEGGFLWNGGLQTLKSFGVDRAKNIPEDYLKWFADLPLFYEDEYRFYVHAGVEPRVPLIEQRNDPGVFLWIRHDFLMNYHDYGKLIVHGHTPEKQIENLGWRLNLDTSCVFGGKLTAAVFSDSTRQPLNFISTPRDNTLYR